MQGILALVLGAALVLGVEAFFWWLLISMPTKPKTRPQRVAAALQAEDRK